MERDVARTSQMLTKMTYLPNKAAEALVELEKKVLTIMGKNDPIRRAHEVQA